MSFKYFDVEAEMQNLGVPPAKPAKPANVESPHPQGGDSTKTPTLGYPPAKPAKPAKVSARPQISNFSGFSSQDPGKPHSPDPPTETAAVTWLKEKLAPGPQHIARLCAAWVGSLSAPTGRDLDDLMQGRWTLGVEAFIGADDRFWWRLPSQNRVQ